MAEALVIVDFQNDFTPGGALAVPHGDEIAGRTSELLDSGRFDLVVATRDWHPADHGSFKEQGGPWPPHCVQGTPGAELNAALDADRVDAIVNAGYRPDLEGYSGFEETDLDEVLRRHGVDQVTIVGLATDYCVKFTALDATAKGFKTHLIEDGSRGVNLKPDDVANAVNEMRKQGVEVIRSEALR